jgi:hypothetical protein
LPKPKHPSSAFIFYKQSKFNEFKIANSALKLVDITKLLSATWNKLSEIERRPFVDLADADQLRYKRQKVGP